jgi:hypothetical protein
VRLGSVPNLAGSIYSVAVVRPGRPTVMVTDYCCPHPVLDEEIQSVTGDYRAVQECVRPLEEVRVRFNGTAQRLRDDSDPLHATPGDPVRLGIDVRWLTDGASYQWRLTTRYEMPCHVRGTVTIDGEEISVDGPGQRDHSWGPRDWWSNDWMWTAFHLDDGTRVHAVAISEYPGMVIGYVQKDGQIVEELAAGSSIATFADNGLVSTAHLTLGHQPLEVEVEPHGFGALRMESPEGKVSFFPRALATFRIADGRTGTGWIEWNINQR